MKKVVLTTTSSFTAGGFDSNLEIVHNPYGRRLSEKEVIDLIVKYDPVGIIAGVEPLTDKVMKSAKSLRVISRCGTGLDSVDLESAAEYGISVLNTPDAPTEAVSELTIGLIISLLRNIPMLDQNIRNGSWKGSKGHLLRGKKVGIIGCGRIGSRVAELLKSFGCEITGFDPGLKRHESIELQDLDELLSTSDIITLHVPLNNSTRNLISTEQINIMKKETILINASRGGLVDESALYHSLKTGKIAGAAIDCFDKEPYKGELTDLENVILSPHMGSSTYETRIKMESKSVDNLMHELKKLYVL